MLTGEHPEKRRMSIKASTGADNKVLFMRKVLYVSYTKNSIFR
jgi:hypothetical protein